jgi:hypothetical protein
MYVGKTLFTQVMDFLPWKTFHRIVARYGGDHRVRRLSCAEQFRVMAFAQLTYRESLRDIEACLRAQRTKLYHMGIRGEVSRNTLANANAVRDWRIYADFAQALIHHAQQLYAEDDFGVELDKTVYALDSTLIDLSLTLFPWAPHQRSRAAIKLHTLLDLRGPIPAFVHVSGHHMADVEMLDLLIPEPGAFYIMDRGYIDFTRLYALNKASAIFVVRDKANTKFRRRYSRPVDRTKGMICDQTIVLTGKFARDYYPQPLRRIKVRDPDDGKALVLLSNNLDLPATSIADLYRCRWQIEIFFKWVKQHLRIKAFLWHLRECRAHTNLDCDLRLRPRRHRPKTPCPRGQSLHNPPDSQPHGLRESAHQSAVSCRCDHARDQSRS